MRLALTLEPMLQLFAEDTSAPVFLGEDLLAYLLLALGGALLVGNVVALVRPPAAPGEGELRRAPVARSVTMAVVGLIAAAWALASLLR